MSEASAPVERLSYRLVEASKMLGVAKSTLHDMLRRGELRSVRLGRVVLIPRAELDRLLSGESARRA